MGWGWGGGEGAFSSGIGAGGGGPGEGVVTVDEGCRVFNIWAHGSQARIKPTF